MPETMNVSIPPSCAQQRERAVAGADEVARAVDDALQERFQVALAQDAEPRAVQGEQLPVLPGQPRPASG